MIINCWTGDDDSHDELVDALRQIETAILEAPAQTSKDVAEKFRFAALLIEDDEAGMLNSEPDAVFGALLDLARLRCAQWKKSFRFMGEQDPFYGHLLQEEPT